MDCPRPVVPIEQHADAISAEHRFTGVSFYGSPWELAHLDSFAFQLSLDDDLVVDVVVLFSCHCFTHDPKNDARPRIPPEELYRDGVEVRVLNERRFELSRAHLRGVVYSLPSRGVRIADAGRPNFFLAEVVDHKGTAVTYLVIFEVKKDRARKRRLLLRIQTAYPVESLNRRQKEAGKMRFEVLARKIYAGERIRG